MSEPRTDWKEHGIRIVRAGELALRPFPKWRFFGEIRAREGQADFLAGQILEISDEGSNDYLRRRVQRDSQCPASG